MTTQELLDEVSRTILRDRSSIVSGPADSLWSDDSLLRYINEAQMRLATIGLVIRDATTPSVSQVPVIAGKMQYTLHPSVLAVVSARYDYDKYDLVRTGHSALASYAQPDNDNLSFAVTASEEPPGKPRAWASDEQLDIKTGVSGIVSLRVYPEPSADYTGTIYLRTIRKPLKVLSLDSPDDVPEVPEQYHLGLLDWAAYRALRTIDSDVGSMSTANQFRGTFDEMVNQAKRDTLRKLFAPSSWAFGRGGFSWEH